LWKIKQFLQRTPGGALMCGAWERAPKISPKSGSARTAAKSQDKITQQAVRDSGSVQ